jgi:Zn-dependent protease with chaperone function
VAADANKSQWESSPRTLSKVLLLLVLLLSALGYLVYRIAAPFVADMVASVAPGQLVATISNQTLATLEREVLEPTTLPEERQARIREAFARMLDRTGAYRLVFASSPELGPNAAALPSGIIILTDELVRLARDDREIVSVLAHEAGHVQERHGVRLVVRAFTFDVLMGLLLSDYSSLAASASSTLVHAKYSRDFEREADAFAAQALRASGVPVSVLADILQRMEHEGAARRQGPRPPLLDYLDSHPATAERLDYLRNTRLQGAGRDERQGAASKDPDRNRVATLIPTRVLTSLPSGESVAPLPAGRSTATALGDSTGRSCSTTSGD